MPANTWALTILPADCEKVTSTVDVTFPMFAVRLLPVQVVTLKARTQSPAQIIRVFGPVSALESVGSFVAAAEVGVDLIARPEGQIVNQIQTSCFFEFRRSDPLTLLILQHVIRIRLLDCRVLFHPRIIAAAELSSNHICSFYPIRLPVLLVNHDYFQIARTYLVLHKRQHLR